MEEASQLLMLQSQMTWVLGNLPERLPTEIFALQLRTPAPITGYSAPAPGRTGDLADESDEAEGTLPRTLEAWIRAQKGDENFDELLEGMKDKVSKDELWINASDGHSPTIIVPRSCQELLVRDTHQRMYHLAHAKVYAFLRRSYTWPTIKKDVRVWLNDCPACDLNKARQNTAHGLFSALPVYAPRARWCMDFQGQGLASTGETEALALIDPTSRYVVVIPLANREAKTWIQPFLDRIVFTFGVPDTLHSDAAPEFLSEALALLSQTADIQTTTTLAHNARGNGTIEVFWRFWNRCLRMLSDEHYCQWPVFASRIAFAYVTAAHEGIGGVTPFKIYHGAPARNPLTASLLEHETDIDEDKELCLPEDFATAVAVSTKAFTQLAK
jgi:transposase InsO family protein